MALPPPSIGNSGFSQKPFGKLSQKKPDFNKYNNSDNSEKIERGSNGRNWISVFFGFLISLLVESLFIYAVLWILRDAEIVSWQLSLRDVVTLSAVTLLWRAFHRSIFLASHK